MHHRCSWFRVGRAVQQLGFLSLAFGLAAAPVASGQGRYTSDEVKDMGRYRATSAKAYARAPSGNADDRNQFGRFLLDVYFPSMTQYDASSLANLGRMRYDFMRNFVRGAAPAAQKDATQLAHKKMKEIVKGPYHPSVRYNAMLILGDLDATYSGQGGEPPAPLPDANKYLTSYVSNGINTERAPAFLIVGALIGLERHAASLAQLPAANRSATAGALLAVLEKDGFPHEISPSVSQWIKVIAARGLASVGVLGDGNRVHNSMLKFIGDETARLNNRVRVAELLEAYGEAYKSAAGIDERQTVQTFLQLASDIAADEKERALDYEEGALGRGGGGAPGGFRYNQNTELPDEYQVRRLLHRLNGLNKGITAVRPAIGDERLGALLDQVLTATNPVIGTATARNMVLLNLTRDVKQMADVVAQTSASLGVEAVEAPPESDEEEEAEMLEEEAAAAEPEA